jgi:hypothetical protein
VTSPSPPRPRAATARQDSPQAAPGSALRHLITAVARATAILRTCQFTAEHDLTLDHAWACKLLEDEEEGITYGSDGHDILSLARTLETRLTAAEIYISDLSDIILTHVLSDPAARPPKT